MATEVSNRMHTQDTNQRSLATQSVAIQLRDIEKRFDSVPAVRGLNLDINNGELLVLLGPSGCGKTTTLNMLAGLERPTSGQILFGDRVVNDLPPEERDIAMVFQSIALYPHLNVRENIGFALRTQKVAKQIVAQRTAEVAETLGLSSFLDRGIAQLSGGQRQRVAIAKALVRRPALFLLDEPFSSLDAELRRQMRSELIRIHREVETTMVFVTHDQEEAMAIADRIGVMNEGQLVQLGPPLDLYQAPRNAWVARFIGSHPINLLKARMSDQGDQIEIQIGDMRRVAAPAELLSRVTSQANAPDLLIGVRPEYLRISSDSERVDNDVTGEIYTRQFLGTDVLYEIRIGGQILRAVTPISNVFELEQQVRISIDWKHVFVFDASSEERIFPPKGE